MGPYSQQHLILLALGAIGTGLLLPVLNRLFGGWAVAVGLIPFLLALGWAYRITRR